MKHLKNILCCIVVFTLLASAFSAEASASWYDEISGGTYKAIVGEPYVAETFSGVDALYSLVPGSYQCSELIPRFYKEAYGLDTFIFAGYGSTFGFEPIEMQTAGYKFVTPETPSAGDIIYSTSAMREGKGDHWAIVKSYNGNSITLFEQNVKYNGKAGTGRTIKYPSENYYIYSPRKISDNSKPALNRALETPATTAVHTTSAPVTAAPTTTAVHTTAVPTTVTTTAKLTQAPTTTVIHTTAATTAVHTTAEATTMRETTTAVKIEDVTVPAEELGETLLSEESTTFPEDYSAVVAMRYNAPETVVPEETEAESTEAKIDFKPIAAGSAALIGFVVFIIVLLTGKKSRG